MCDKDTCNDASCCGECEPWNCLEQQVNDILATKEDQLQGYVGEAKDAAAESKASAEASAQSAAESKEFRDEAETAASTAVAAEEVVLGVANTLQDTSDKLEQVADELNTAIAGIAVSSWFYTTVSENQTVIPVPANKNAVDVQSIYIEGSRQSPFRGFEFDKTSMIITLAEPLPLGLEIEIVLGTYNSDNPNDFAHTLASDNGASLVGTDSGITVQQKINNFSVNTREQWRRSLAEAGLTLVDGSFEEGATANSETDAVWHISGGQCYVWSGVFPKTVPANSTPNSTGGVAVGAWSDVHDVSLRSDLASKSKPGASLVGLPIGTVADVSQMVTPEQFYSEHPGEADWAVMIQAAYDYALANNKTVLLANVYRVKSTIKHYAGLSVLQTGVIWADPAGDFTTTDAAGNAYKAVYHILSPTTTYSDKRTYIPRIYIRHTQNIDWGAVYYQHVNAIGVLMTHIAGVTVGQMETFGMLLGGANIGGTPKSGYEIRVLSSCFGIMGWEDPTVVGLDIKVGDSHFINPVCIDYPIGIRIDGSGANTLVDPHPWGHPKTVDNLYPNRQMLIGFEIINGNNTLYRPYADSVAKLDPNVGATMSNGGYGFVIRSSKNVLTDVIVSSHVAQVVTGGLPFFAAYFVGSVGGNKFELRDLQHKTTHFSAQPIAWDETTYPTIPFRNKWIGLRSELQQNIALTGTIGITGTGITQTGNYTLRQIADDVHLSCDIAITEASAVATNNIYITLPRGMGFYPGATIEIEDRLAVSKGLAAPTCRVIGVILPGDFTRIVLYAERADGTRFNLQSLHTQAGSLKFRIIGRLSNGI